MPGPRKKLADPPINEVVCGLFFPSIAGLDPITVGKFSQALPEYPKHAVLPAVTDEAGFMLAVGPSPLRSWLVSEDDEWVIQIQPDRFYLNWRKRGGDYPRFGDSGGKPGVQARTLTEFERFAAFCKSEFSVAPAIHRVEVAKVDFLMQGKHWDAVAELLKIVPMLGALHPSLSEEADVAIRIAEARGGADFMLAIHKGLQSVFGMMPTPGLRIDTRAHRELGGAHAELRNQLGELNGLLNAAFFGLLDPAELGRFGEVS